jgi:hypothetical protein
LTGATTGAAVAADEPEAAPAGPDVVGIGATVAGFVGAGADDAGIAGAAVAGAGCALGDGVAGAALAVVLVVLVVLVEAGSKPGSVAGSGFIGSEAGEKPGTAEPPLAGALADVAAGVAGAFSAGDGAAPAGRLPGSSPPTLAPGVITRSAGTGCGRLAFDGALAFDFDGASRA